MLTWARERNKLTIETLAHKMKRKPAEILLWEKGETDPSYRCLEDLAYKYFHIPLAVFFFSEPPKEPDPVKKFRRLPDYEFERFSEDTFKNIRMAQAYQDSLSIIVKNIDSKKIFTDISPKGQSPSILAKKAREYIGITLEDQFKFSSCESAFKRWRHALEEVGIFTFKDSLKDRFISGFCLIDNRHPIIFINNSNSFSRQIFTLIHEMGHILFGIDGVTDISDSYMEFLNSKDRQVEVYCNEFASHFLVPDESFNKSIALFKEKGITAISEIADHYSVSREVILRKLKDLNLVSINLYQEKSAEWNKDYLRGTRKQKGGSYYLTQLSYLGESFTKAAFDEHRRGNIDKTDLATYLNVKAKNLEKLENRLRW